ncbi:hypothetical protein SNEBB_008305 [Seison nebaliae]|nr:hypothetical protein SNEBB_008305 [Seison nebaliae]
MHDCDHCRLSANYPMIFVGQNVAAGSRNWTNAIQLWHSEHKNFEYNVGSANGGIIGHYTQVMGSEVALLGCGFATCKNIFRRMYTCNYMRGQSNLARPFVKSWHSCQMCKKNCDNKLCNCNGLICKNGGTINLNTCTCNCHHFSFGKQCEFTKCTKDDDEKYCGPFWKPEYCKKFGNIFYRCPFMCDKCKNLTSSEDL